MQTKKAIRCYISSANDIAKSPPLLHRYHSTFIALLSILFVKIVAQFTGGILAPIIAPMVIIIYLCIDWGLPFLFEKGAVFFCLFEKFGKRGKRKNV